VEGNAKLAASGAVVEVGGFAVAGALVQLLSAPITVLVDAASFLVSSATLLLIRQSEPPPAPAAPGGDHPSAWGELREGLGVVLGDPLLRPLAAAELTRQLGVHTWVAMLLLFLTRELHLPPILFGPLFAIGGISSLGGALVVERLSRWLGLGPLLIVSVVFASASLLLVPFAGAPVLVAAVLIGAQQLFDAAGTMAEILQRALVQGLSPTRLLGRVSAGLHLVSWTGMLAGSMLGGLLGETIGLRETLLIGALAALPSALWLVCSPIASIRTLSGGRDDAGPELRSSPPEARP
ncbi:MAG: MFS transporter, partial [Chloroflexi bacterium]|nr:MFS transporter [Chloroflexota bacterium]